MSGMRLATRGATLARTRSLRILLAALGAAFGGAIAVAKGVLIAPSLRWRQSEGTAGFWSTLRSRGCGVVRCGVKLT